MSTNRKTGQRTFFRNEGNSVTIELWGGEYTGYVYHYATIYSTFLIINAFKSRGFWTSKHKYHDSIKYEFKPLNLSDKADW